MKNYYRVIIVFAAVMLLAFNANAQIAVSVDNPTNTTPPLSASYTSLATAITALNSVTGMTGPVTLSLAANNTETAPAGGFLLGSPTLNAVTSATKTITFIKSGVGANPLITAFTPGTTTTTDGIWKILGTDYITISGIDLKENAANTTATQQMEWGFALVKRQNTAPFDGCQNVTIQNCTITLNKANTASTGIYAGNHIATSTTALTITATTDALNNCKLYNNTVSNVYIGIRLGGYNASSPYTLFDQNNEIGNTAGTGNSITNYGGAGSTSYGIYCIYQNSLMIGYNTVNGGTGTTTTLYGIFTTTGNNSSLTIRGNTVTVQGGGTTTTVNAISNATGGSGTTNTLNMYDNIVENCTYSTATSGSMYLLYNSAALLNVNIYNNIIRNNSKSGTSGTLYVLYSSGLAANGIENLYNNSVLNNSCSGTGTVYCLYTNTVATAEKNIYGNTVQGNSAGGQIHSLNQTLGFTVNIHNNQIYNNSSTSALTTAGLVKGIYAASGSSVYIYNNYLSDLKASSSTGIDAIRGIEINSTTASSVYGIYYNTVYLDATSSGANFGTTGIYHTTNATSTTAALELRNNIIVNSSVPAGTGLTVAYRRSDAVLSNYVTMSNNNNFYAGTPGAARLLFYDGTNSIQTITALKALVSPRESASFSELPPFINITTTPYDLHLGTSTATQCESGGVTVSTPNITSDYDGNARYPNPGYPNNPSYPASAPDIGADEFAGRPQDMSGPAISYTNLNNTSSTSNRLFSNVSIIDPSGVNVDPGTAPRIYYKKSTDANTYIGNTNTDDGWKWIETTSGSTPFSFLIDYSILNGGSVSLGETIQYFIVAQDNAGTPNVGINSAIPARSLSTVDLTSDDFPVTGTINSYNIISPISGVILVGTGQTYTSLTENTANGLFKAINDRAVTGNLTVKITSDITETGEVALNQTLEETLYNITIQPNDASLKIISGSYAGGLIRLNGADGITFDGRYSGSGNYLTFSNTSTNTNSAVFHLISLGSNAGASNNTIRNCNILGGANDVTSIFGIYAGGASISTSGTGADNNNLTIQNNNISRTYYGIYVRGVSLTGILEGLNIVNNSIGSSIEADYVTGYGIYLSEMNGANITGNDIFNMIYDGNKYGIYLNANVTNSVFNKNKIHSFNIITSTSTTLYSIGIYFSTSTGTVNNRIDNNAIYDLNYYGSTTNGYYNVGIRMAGGIDYKLYFNSISMTGTAGNTAAGVMSACVYISTAATNIDMQNNILYNARLGTTPANYVIYTVASTTFSSLNYNDYYTTGAVFGYYQGTAAADFSAWVTASGEGVNSKNVNPQFNSNTNLQPLIGSPVLAQGIPISGITEDITGIARNLTSPSMGAYEIGVDASGPNIEYAALSNTSFTNERVLTASITDVSGVPTSGIGLPRLYWKINSGSYNSVTGSFVSGSQYSFTLGNGVLMGDVVSYYIVAQDLMGTPNVSCYPTGGAGGFSFNPPSASTPPVSPSTYVIVQTISGNITVGATGDYPTLTGAGGLFSSINSKSVVGNMNVTILGDITEDGTNELNQWLEEGGSGYTLTIKPSDATEKVISGAVANGMIRFSGADRVIIDGRYGGSGRYLRFRNTNTSNPTFTFINDATGITLQYCYIEGSSTSTSNGIIFFSTGISTGNDNNTITQNIIRDRSDVLAVPYNAVYSTGSAALIKTERSYMKKIPLNSKNSNNEEVRTAQINDGVLSRKENLTTDKPEGTEPDQLFNGDIDYAVTEAAVNNSGNIISNNEIFNFRSYGIYVTATGNGDGWNISSNSFYNNLGTAPSVTQTSIYFIPGANSSGSTINGNFIGGSSANCGGTPWTNTGSVTYYGIQVAAGFTAATTVSNNFISNISLTASGASAFRGIYVTAGIVNINSNTVGHSTNANSIQNAGTSTVYGIYTVDALLNVAGNEIGNITAGTGSVFGIYRGYSASSYDSCKVNSNIVHDLSTQSTSTGLSTSMAACGIVYFPNTYLSNDVVSGNIIYNVQAANTTAVSTAASGFLASNNRAKMTGNKIYGIKNLSTQTTLTAPPIAAGIINRYADNNIFANNIISLAYDQSTNTQYNGIFLPTSGGSGNIFNAIYNTVYIGGTIISGDIPSFGLLRGDNTGTANQITLNIYNNVFYNERTGGTAKQYGIANQCTVLDATGWGAAASNYNMFITPNASIVNLWGPTDYDFTGWKINSSCDARSVSDLNTNVPSADLFTSVSTGDLSIKTGESICWVINSKGVPVTAVNNDYSGISRSTSSENGPTDLGAYEFTTSVLPPVVTASGTGTLSLIQSGRLLLEVTDVTLNTPSKNKEAKLKSGGEHNFVNSAITVNAQRYSGSGVFDTAMTVSPDGILMRAPMPLAKTGLGYLKVTTGGTDPASPVGIVYYYGTEELGNISAEADLILAMYDYNNKVWVPFTQGTGDGQSNLNTTNKTITVTGITRLNNTAFMLCDKNFPLKRTGLDLTVMIQGLYSSSLLGKGTSSMIQDTVWAVIYKDAPWSRLDSIKVVIGTSGSGFGYSGKWNASDPTPSTGANYWIVIRHRSAVETWCATGTNQFSKITGVLTYDFTSAANKAYGDNQILIGTKYCIYNGDINHDGTVDLNDIIPVLSDYDNLDYHIENDMNLDWTIDLNDAIYVLSGYDNLTGAVIPSKILNRKELRSIDKKELLEKIEKLRIKQPEATEKVKTNNKVNKK